MSLDFYLNYKLDGNEIMVFDRNITHNLGKMAAKVLYKHLLWRPEEIKAVYAKDVIDILKTGLLKLKSNPTYFKRFNSPNGWGLYKHFVPFVEECLGACEKFPSAKIYVSI